LSSDHFNAERFLYVTRYSSINIVVVNVYALENRISVVLVALTLCAGVVMHVCCCFYVSFFVDDDSKTAVSV